MDKIAICITTRNRPNAFHTCIREWFKLIPQSESIMYFVVDDASYPTYVQTDYVFGHRRGIPKAKNKCLEVAMDWGADHIFLADDDVYPISPDAIKPYIESGINHLCFTFTEAYGDVYERRHPDIIDGFAVHELANGCMIYLNRLCVEKVGGFDTAYGLGCYEHIDLSRRIHNAGLTPHMFMDILGSDRLFHSMDKHGEAERSFSKQEREMLLEVGNGHFFSNSNSREFKPFR